MVSSLAKVAEAFGVRLDTVKKEWRKRDMPGRPGHWDLAAIAEWKRTRDRDPEGEGDAEEGGDEEVRAMRKRKLALENEIKQLEADKRARVEREAAGDMLPRKEVEAEVAQALQRIRRGLGRIPQLLTPAHGRVIATEVGRLIGNVLTGLVVELQQTPQTDEEGTEAAKPVRQKKPKPGV